MVYNNMIQIKLKMLCRKVQSMMSLNVLNKCNPKISTQKLRDIPNKTKKISKKCKKISNNKSKSNPTKKPTPSKTLIASNENTNKL